MDTQATQVGDQTVSITVSDGLNSRTQTFVLSVFGVTQELASVQILSATGGTVTVNTPTSSLNGLTLTFPPLALPGDTTIRVRELTTSSALAGGQLGNLRGISLEPDGLVLNSPVTVTIPFDPATLNSGGGIVLPDFLGVFFLDPHTGQKVFQDTFRVDTVQNVLVGTLEHFSIYSFTNVGRLCPPPTAEDPDCGSTYKHVASQYLPALLVHGFSADTNGGGAGFLGVWNGVGNGLGDKGYWGKLQEVLGKPVISDSPDRIGAWRLDWDSRDVSFRKTAFLLAAAIAHIKGNTKQRAVNIVAHSFGGILTRTYLQGMASADGTGDADGPVIPFRNDVNKVMTLGTPHQGIGNDLEGKEFSRSYASYCAEKSTEFLIWPTCFETATALKDRGRGKLLLALNEGQLPFLLAPAGPAYHVIIGDHFKNGNVSEGLVADDGAITTVGANICEALNGGCNSRILVTKIATGFPAEFALCHALGAGYCGKGINIPMVPVDTKTHPLWPIIHGFLITGSPADIAPQPVVSSTLTVSAPSHGNVTSDLGGIQCGTTGTTCSAIFTNGTPVTLSARADPGFTFSGWSGACVNKVGPCKLVIGSEDTAQATFAPKPVSTPVPAPGKWFATKGNLATARHSHTATLLQDGTVLVAKGCVDSFCSTRTASAERYDPVTGNWTAAGVLSIAGNVHTATRLESGKVLVAGGSGNNGAVFLADLYDPSTNTWTPTDRLITARLNHTGTLLANGKVLVAGGQGFLASAELYDPTTEKWSATGDLRIARGLHSATRLSDGKVLVAGGCANGGCTAHVARAELYDPATGLWSFTGEMVNPRDVHTATLLSNGKVLVTGGHGDHDRLPSAELYDPVTGLWTLTEPMHADRAVHSAVLLLNGKVLVMGTNDTASTELYDPATGHWTLTGDMTTIRDQIRSVGVRLQNGQVLISGGRDPQFAPLPSSELYQP